MNECQSNWLSCNKNSTVCWEDLKYNRKHFQLDLCRMKEHILGVQTIFCLKFKLFDNIIYQLGSLAKSAWIRLNWSSSLTGGFHDFISHSALELWVVENSFDVYGTITPRVNLSLKLKSLNQPFFSNCNFAISTLWSQGQIVKQNYCKSTFKSE